MFVGAKMIHRFVCCSFEDVISFWHTQLQVFLCEVEYDSD